jgi:hypothetical protein
MKSYLIAGALIGAAVLPVLAQTSGGDTNTLSALLVEVRALRVAIERATATTPQIQLLTARLTVQNERVTRATHDADEAHQAFVTSQTAAANFASELANVEERLGRETDPPRVQQLKEQQQALKQQMDAQVASQGALQARETELANVLAAEQGQWAELNRRLDALERQLAERR